MILDVNGLLDVWTRPTRNERKAVTAFRRFYHDSVLLNGYQLSVLHLVDRARTMQAALDHIQVAVLDVADAGESVAVAFELSGRLVGPLATAGGTVWPTGQRLSMRVMDLLHLSAGLIDRVTMVADELRSLAAIGAVSVVNAMPGPNAPEPPPLRTSHRVPSATARAEQTSAQREAEPRPGRLTLGAGASHHHPAASTKGGPS